MAQRKAPSFLKRGRFCGFSMIELVIVLVLVGMLAVYAIPRMTTPQSITLPAVANQLIGTIRYAQNLSMSQGQRYRVNFAAGSYGITDMSGSTASLPPTAGTIVSLSPAVLSGWNPPLTNGYVAFDTRGVPYISATATLAATVTLTLTSGSDTATMTIAPETGRVK